MTLLSYLRALAQRKPEKKMLGDETGWLNASEVCRTVEALGRSFAGAGLRRGDLAALRAPRCLKTALLLLGLRAAGVTVILTDPRQKIDEVLDECEQTITPRARIQYQPGEALRIRIDGQEISSTDEDVSDDTPLPLTDAGEPAFVIFTSGSTGAGKAVVISENALIVNLLESLPLGDYSHEDIALGALPLHHVFGLVLLAGTAVLEYAEFFPAQTEVPALLLCIEREKITRMNGVPSLYLAMADQHEGYDLSSLRCGFIAGGPVTPEQFARIERKLQMTLISVYGMSECVGITCSSFRDPEKVRADGVGRVYPLNTVRIIDSDGKEVRQGQTGEIWVRGPMRMLGYYGTTLDEDTFFATGDLGWMDQDGVLHLSGRKKEIIIRNGNNISPRRIEEALLRLKGVRAAAVVGVPDEKEGEVPCAMIVGRAAEEELRPLLRKNEMPSGILTVEALPLTASGKPDRQKIREVLMAWKNL